MAGKREDNKEKNNGNGPVKNKFISKEERAQFQKKMILKERAQKKRKRKRIFTTIGLLFIVITFLFFGSIIKFISSLKTDTLKGAIPPNKNESLNILLLGMDIGDAEQVENEAIRRTDTIMVLNYNPKTKKVNLVSIPRDTLIEVDAYDGNGDLIPYWKINSAYALGGEEEVVKHVKTLLDININYIVEVNYDAFRDFIDAIGGVEMYIERDMYYDDDTQDLHINFKKGETVLLDGKKAEEFFRWRKNNDGTGLEDGDLGRIQNQQKFISKVIKKCMSPTILFKLPKILNSIQSNIATNMPATDIIAYGLKFIRNEGINMTTLQGYEETIYGQSFVVADRESNAELIESLKSGEAIETEVSRSIYRVLVLNGTRINGLASELKDDMIDIGYSEIEVDNTGKTTKSYIICNDKSLVNILKLDTGITKAEKDKEENYTNYDAVIVLGEDFKEFGQ